MIPSTKLCTRCHAIKPETSFTADSRNKDGRHSHCKECRAQYQKWHYHKKVKA